MGVRSLALMGACLVGLAVAGSSESFDVALQELEHVQFLTNNLTESVNAWDGKNVDLALFNIHQPANATTIYVRNATDVLKQHPTTYDITQAFRIGSPAQDLAYAVNASIASLHRKKDAFVAAGIPSIVVLDLKDLLNATVGFGEVLTSYVDEDLRVVAQNLQQQIIKSLEQGITCFENKNMTCETAVVDPDRTRKLALKYNAMKPNGYPIV